MASSSGQEEDLSGLVVRGGSAYRRLRKKLTVENLWIYILALLSERPVYGYEFAELISRRYGFRPGKVTCYVVLYKLRRERLVAEEEVKHSREGPARRYYRITDKGMEELRRAKRFLREVLGMVPEG